MQHLPFHFSFQQLRLCWLCHIHVQLAHMLCYLAHIQMMAIWRRENYCPSINDKQLKFADHLLLNSNWKVFSEWKKFSAETNSIWFCLWIIEIFILFSFCCRTINFNLNRKKRASERHCDAKIRSNRHEDKKWKRKINDKINVWKDVIEREQLLVVSMMMMIVARRQFLLSIGIDFIVQSVFLLFFPLTFVCSDGQFIRMVTKLHWLSVSLTHCRMRTVIKGKSGEENWWEKVSGQSKRDRELQGWKKCERTLSIVV